MDRLRVAWLHGCFQVSHSELNRVEVELENRRVPPDLGPVAEACVEDAAFADGLHPRLSEVVVLALNPLDAHVRALGIERKEDTQVPAVVGWPEVEDLVGDSEVLAAERGKERMVRLLDQHGHVLVPRVADERGPEKPAELGPMGIGADGIVIRDDPAAIGDIIEQALAEHSFHGFLRLAVALQFLHRCVTWRDPRAAAIIHHDGVELADVLRKELSDVPTEHRLEGTGLLAEYPHRTSPVRYAVALMRVLVREV